MPVITLTLRDTPSGAVAIHSSFKPAVGHPISPAQGHALEVINRTLNQWGQALDDVFSGVDIDAAHRTRDRVVNFPELDDNSSMTMRPEVAEMARHVSAQNPHMSQAQCLAYSASRIERGLT